MIVTPSKLISFANAAKEGNCEVSDILDLCYQKNVSIIVQRQLPKEEQENIKSKISSQFSSAVVTYFEIFSSKYSFSDQDVVAALIGNNLSAAAVKQVQKLLSTTPSQKCSSKKAEDHIKELVLSEKFGKGNNQVINQKFIVRIKELAKEGASATKICEKFTNNDPGKPYSDPMLWRFMKIWRNFNLISDEQIESYEQILEQPYWSLGVGGDPYGRNFISLLLCQKKIIGKPGQPILMIEPGKTYESVVNKEAFHWYLRDDVTIEDLFLLREDLDIFRGLSIAGNASSADRDKKQEASHAQANSAQLLTRPAIKKNYTNLTEDAWNHRFRKEKDNGLIKAKVQGNKKYLYRQSDVEKWLFENGRYTQQAFIELHNASSQKTPTQKTPPPKCKPM